MSGKSPNSFARVSSINRLQVAAIVGNPLEVCRAFCESFLFLKKHIILFVERFIKFRFKQQQSQFLLRS